MGNGETGELTGALASQLKKKQTETQSDHKDLLEAGGKSICADWASGTGIIDLVHCVQ